MSHLRDVEQHARSLTDIRDIMNSMKSLAYMESRKLSHIVEAQRAVTEQIRTAASDLLQFHSQILPSGPPALAVQIVFGTERGFCGNLNERLVAELPRENRSEPARPAVFIAVGRKLHAVLENSALAGEDIRRIQGPGVADEATAVLNEIVNELDNLQRGHGPLSVSSLHHGSEGKMRFRELLPPFRDGDGDSPTFSHPPILNLDPAELLVALGDQYLFSALFEMLYDSLRSENQHRVSHLTDAVRHLDERTADLARRANALRQEEITQEIEVILLSASGLEDGSTQSSRTRRRGR